MKHFLILTRLQLRCLLSSLQVGRGNRKRAVSGWAALAFLSALCLYISCMYSFALGSQLAQAGALDLLLVMLPGMAVILGLMFTAFAAQGVVFSGRDADLLLSMPVPAFTVLLSKLAALYAENLLVCALLVLPAGAARIWFGGGGGALLVLRLVIGVPFLALLPTTLSLLAGFLLSWLGGRFASRKLVNLLLYTLLMAGVLLLAIQINLGISGLAAGAVGGTPAGGVWSIPFQLFQQGVCGDWETLAMFCLLSTVPVLAAAWLFSRFYQQVLTGLRSHGRRTNYRLTRLKGTGRRRALLRKEASRFFGTPIYLFNTGFGLVILIIGGIAAAVMRGQLQEILAQAGFNTGEVPLSSLAAAAICFTLSTAAITGSSVSLEGQNLWILKESPVSPSEIFAAKAGFQILLTIPCLLIGAAGMSWGLGLTPAECGTLFLAGAAFSAFAALMGLIVNLCFPKMDAVNDTVVVKQSAASLISGFGGMAAAVLAGALVWLLQRSTGELAGLLVGAAVLLAGCVPQIWWLRTRGAARFMEL